MSSDTPEPFSFRAFLAADLRRFRSLTVRPGSASDAAWTGLFSPRFAPVLLVRIAQGFQKARLGPAAKLVSLINFTVFGIEVAGHCRIGKGLFFAHTQGTVIGAASIGDNVTIYHNVTLGARSLDLAFDPAARPVVGDDVLIASGAKVLGGIRIGDRAKIGVNALVLTSVPADAIVRAPLGQIMEAGLSRD